MTSEGGLREYLRIKREAMSATAEALSSGDAARETITAECSAEGLSGVRRIRIRDFQVISDSGPGFGGFGLGPNSPELMLGMLASCLTHTYLIGAAWRGVPLDSVQVRVEAQNNDAALLGLATSDPATPFGLKAYVRVESGAPQEVVDALHEFVETSCPLTRFLREPQEVVVVRL
jgi:uncharacterized OsmC-like protein